MGNKVWKVQADPGLPKSASKCCSQIVTKALWKECIQGNFCRDINETLISRGFQWILCTRFPIWKCASSCKTRDLHIFKQHINSCKISPLLRWTSHQAGVILSRNTGVFWKYRCFQLSNPCQCNALDLPNQVQFVIILTTTLTIHTDIKKNSLLLLNASGKPTKAGWPHTQRTGTRQHGFILRPPVQEET